MCATRQRAGSQPAMGSLHPASGVRSCTELAKWMDGRDKKPPGTRASSLFSCIPKRGRRRDHLEAGTPQLETAWSAVFLFVTSASETLSVAGHWETGEEEKETGACCARKGETADLKTWSRAPCTCREHETWPRRRTRTQARACAQRANVRLPAHRRLRKNCS